MVAKTTSKEAATDGMGLSEPLAQQIVLSAKDLQVVPSSSAPSVAFPRDLGSSAVSIVGRSLEDAVDKML